MSKKKWMVTGGGVLLLFTGIVVFGALRTPKDDLSPLDPYVLKKGHSFKRLERQNATQYLHIFAEDLKGISLKEARDLLTKDTHWAEGQTYLPNQTPATLVLQTDQGSLTLIDGPVPYDPQASISVEQDIYSSGTESLILRTIERLGFRIAR